MGFSVVRRGVINEIYEKKTLAIDEDDSRYILRYKEGIIDPSVTSILSVAQMRNYSVNVEDKPMI